MEYFQQGNKSEEMAGKSSQSVKASHRFTHSSRCFLIPLNSSSPDLSLSPQSRPSRMSGGDYRRRGFDRKDSKISKKQKLILSAEEKLESKLGYDLFSEGEKRLGWLLTFSSVSIDFTYTHSCVFALQFQLELKQLNLT